MTIVTWPSDLPCWVVPESFSSAQPDGRLRTQADMGPPKVRLLTGAAITPLSAQIIVDGNKLARFNRFWREDISNGVDPFHYRDQVFDQRQLADEDGNILTDEDGNILLNESWWLVQFSSAPSYQAMARRERYAVSLPLEILP